MMLNTRDMYLQNDPLAIEQEDAKLSVEQEYDHQHRQHGADTGHEADQSKEQQSDALDGGEHTQDGERHDETKSVVLWIEVNVVHVDAA